MSIHGVGKRERIRVCMIVHAFYLKDARVRRYAEWLVRRGDMVDVICLREDGEKKFEECSGVSVFRVNLGRRRGGKLSYFIEYLSSLSRFFLLLNRLTIAGNRYQVIHVHNFPNFLVFAATVTRMFGSKVLLDVHDPMPELFRSKYGLPPKHWLVRFLRLEETCCISVVHAVIAANDDFRDILVSRGCPTDRITVVLNVPDDTFLPSNHFALTKPAGRMDPFVILYVGTLAERYGIKTALAAAAKLRKNESIPEIEFHILPKIETEGAYKAELIAFASELGIGECLHICEPVPHQEVAGLMQKSSVCVYTPDTDVHMDIALSLKIPEIAAVGVPIVASRLSVLLRYFGENAIFMCEPGSVDDCAAKILQVHDKPQDVERRTARARVALGRMRWEEQRAAYFSVLDRLTIENGDSREGRSESFRVKLKRTLRSSGSFATYFSGLSLLWHALIERRAVRILTYHGVVETPSNSFEVSLKSFEKQMRFLHERCNVLSEKEYRHYLSLGNGFPRDSVLITFDDGFKNFKEFAYPVLKRYGLPAMCFIVATKAASDDLQFMNWKDLRELSADDTISIGSHSLTHRSLAGLCDKELKQEIEQSKAMIEGEIERPVTWFAYPYGTRRDFNKRCATAVAESGYKRACTSINGVNTKGSNLLALHRTKIEAGDSFWTFTRIVHGALDFWIVVDLFFAVFQRKGENEI